jgi:hypothetical protein
MDLIIRIERKRYDDRHWIKPSPPRGNSEQQYRVFYGGEEIGSWSDPECAAARWLLAQGKAHRSDMLVTYRGRKPSLTGKIGWFADHAVKDGPDGTPRFVKHVPMSETDKARVKGSG